MPARARWVDMKAREDAGAASGGARTTASGRGRPVGRAKRGRDESGKAILANRVYNGKVPTAISVARSKDKLPARFPPYLEHHTFRHPGKHTLVVFSRARCVLIARATGGAGAGAGGLGGAGAGAGGAGAGGGGYWNPFQPRIELASKAARGPTDRRVQPRPYPRQLVHYPNPDLSKQRNKVRALVVEYNREAETLSDWEREGEKLELESDSEEEDHLAPASAMEQAPSLDPPSLAGAQQAVDPAPFADAGEQAVPPPLADAGAQALLVPLADAVSDQEFAEQLLAEEEEERSFWAGVHPLLKDPKSPAQLKHMAFHDEVVARMKAGPVQGVPVTRVELVAQEALVVLGRLNRILKPGYAPMLESESLRKYQAGEPLDDGDHWNLARRRTMLAASVEYYMVQAGVIRPSVIVKKVCDSRVASMIA
jgi:hypothetical protein